MRSSRRTWSSEPEWYYYAHIIIMDVLSIGYNVLPVVDGGVFGRKKQNSLQERLLLKTGE